MDYARLDDQLIPLVRQAGQALLHYYADAAALDVQTKANHTPLTAADLAAHDIVVNGLRQLYPDIPVLSEEDAAPLSALAERKQWPRLWLVDPLDGTREFLDGSDNFCINIALVENGEARFGLIYLPISDAAYVGIVGQGAWCQTGTTQRAIACRNVDNGNTVTLISSRRRFKQSLLELEQRLAAKFHHIERVGIGSGVKFCRVAEGAADIYPCFGPTYEWDTAAGQALVEAAGGRMCGLAQQPFRYNRRASLLNGGFYVFADSQYDWSSLLPAQN
ncbi:MAG: 3'(2'),5'-bisphosphate nucleotidase CysQ [Pseudomonadales bacterium]